MTAQAAVETALPAVAPEPVSAASFALGRLTLIAVAAFVPLFACWHVAQTAPYRSGTGIGYALGLVGGSLMLILLLYPLRKRMHFMQHWGPLKYWFRLHMVGGILGPALVVFHSTFRVGSLNAAVALVSMLLVVASGLVGRFLYRKIHRGLYGSELTLKELQQALQADLAAVEPLLAPLPAVADDLRAFVAMVAAAAARTHRRHTARRPAGGAVLDLRAALFTVARGAHSISVHARDHRRHSCRGRSPVLNARSVSPLLCSAPCSRF